MPVENAGLPALSPDTGAPCAECSHCPRRALYFGSYPRPSEPGGAPRRARDESGLRPTVGTRGISDETKASGRPLSDVDGERSPALWHWKDERTRCRSSIVRSMPQDSVVGRAPGVARKDLPQGSRPPWFADWSIPGRVGTRPPRPMAMTATARSRGGERNSKRQ
jgi:hypothetical protein